MLPYIALGEISRMWTLESPKDPSASKEFLAFAGRSSLSLSSSTQPNSLSLSLYQAGETRYVQTSPLARTRAPAVRGCLTWFPPGDFPQGAWLCRERLPRRVCKRSIFNSESL